MCTQTPHATDYRGFLPICTSKIPNFEAGKLFLALFCPELSFQSGETEAS